MPYAPSPQHTYDNLLMNAWTAVQKNLNNRNFTLDMVEVHGPMVPYENRRLTSFEQHLVNEEHRLYTMTHELFLAAVHAR